MSKLGTVSDSDGRRTAANEGYGFNLVAHLLFDYFLQSSAVDGERMISISADFSQDIFGVVGRWVVEVDLAEDRWRRGRGIGEVRKQMSERIEARSSLRMRMGRW